MDDSDTLLAGEESVRASIFAFAAAFASFIPVYAGSLDAPPEPIPHDDCVSCHPDAMPDAALTNGNHPVGGVYPKNERYRPPSAPSGFGSTVAEDFLVGGRVECTSCHFSHFVNTDHPKRLRIDLAEPGTLTPLCTACHRVQ